MTGLSSGELEPLEDLDLEDENQRQSTKYISFHSREEKRKGFSPKKMNECVVMPLHGCDSFIEIANKERCAWNRVRRIIVKSLLSWE